MSDIRRWECPTCGRTWSPGERKPKVRHYWRGERCDGEIVEVEYVPRSDLRGAVEERDWLLRFAAQARGWEREQVLAAMARDLAARTPGGGR